MFSNLVKRLWQDDGGSVIATEYLALGSIVALGSMAGLATVRDATNAEMQDYGNSVREMRQSYSAPGMSGGNASKQGSAVNDSRGGSRSGGSGYVASDYSCNP